ncbi:MAG: hypothetical protein KIT27_03120 [Legionellales bacterium]|nr:hypothetical protein [Legionellales bacterium]
MKVEQRYFNSDIDVTINLSDLIENSNKLLYVTLVYNFKPQQKRYRLSQAVDVVYSERNVRPHPVQSIEIDPQEFFGDFASRQHDALGIVKKVLPDIKLKKHFFNWLH